MRTLPFLLVTVVSGAIAGTILGLINLGVVEPFIDKAIELEIQNDIQADQTVNMNEITDYRTWQKGGEIVGGLVYGISLSSLFGIVFAYSRKSLPGNNAQLKAILPPPTTCRPNLILPPLKYPTTPPAVGDPTTNYSRQSLFVAFRAISGLSALGVIVLVKKLNQTVPKKMVIACATYGAIMIISYIVMPSNPDKISISMNLIETFRLVSAGTIVMFWGVLGLIFGTLWHRFDPHNFEKITAF